MKVFVELTPFERYFEIKRCRYGGASFSEIGTKLGISKQRACKIFHSELPKKTNCLYKTKLIEKDLWTT